MSRKSYTFQKNKTQKSYASCFMYFNTRRNKTKIKMAVMVNATIHMYQILLTDGFRFFLFSFHASIVSSVVFCNITVIVVVKVYFIIMCNRDFIVCYAFVTIQLKRKKIKYEDWFCCCCFYFNFVSNFDQELCIFNKHTNDDDHE